MSVVHDIAVKSAHISTSLGHVSIDLENQAGDLENQTRDLGSSDTSECDKTTLEGTPILVLFLRTLRSIVILTVTRVTAIALPRSPINGVFTPSIFKWEVTLLSA